MQVILLDYPGVKGEVTIAGYEGYIAVESFDMSAGAADSEGEGKGKGATLSQRGYADGDGFEDFDDPPAGGPKGPAKEPKRLGIDSLKITKSVDRATPKLLSLAFKKKADTGPTVRLVVFRAFERQAGLGGGVSLSLSSDGLSVDTDVINWHEPFLEIELIDAHVAGHSLSVAKDSLQETIDISFKQLNVEYIVYQNGKRLGTVAQQIDLTKKS